MKEDSFSSNTRLSADEVIRSIETNLTTVDAARIQGYSQLAPMRDAKANSLAKEQRLLAIKTGGNHPRIAQAADAFEANENLRREIAVVREVIETSLPSVDETSFVVYGFVRRRSNQSGIAGLTLALSDENGTWIKRFGYACTDQRGYFELTIKAEEKTKTGSTVDLDTNLTDEEKKKIEAEKARAAATGIPTPASTPYSSSTGAAATSDTTRLSTMLRVYNREGRTIHTEKNPVTIKAGALDYRVIYLDDGDEDCGCTPPPEKSNGKPTPSGPVNQTPDKTPLKPNPSANSEERVSELKTYEAVVPAAAAGQPLEAIRGIGPKNAEKLRAAGIADVAAFEKTPGQKLVDVAGFDKTPPKPAAVTKSVEPTPEEKTPVTKPVARAPAKPAKEKTVVKKKVSTKTPAVEKKKRPQK